MAINCGIFLLVWSNYIVTPFWFRLIIAQKNRKLKSSISCAKQPTEATDISMRKLVDTDGGRRWSCAATARSPSDELASPTLVARDEARRLALIHLTVRNLAAKICWHSRSKESHQQRNGEEDDDCLLGARHEDTYKLFVETNGYLVSSSARILGSFVLPS